MAKSFCVLLSWHCLISNYVPLSGCSVLLLQLSIDSITLRHKICPSFNLNLARFKLNASQFQALWKGLQLPGFTFDCISSFSRANQPMEIFFPHNWAPIQLAAAVAAAANTVFLFFSFLSFLFLLFFFFYFSPAHLFRLGSPSTPALDWQMAQLLFDGCFMQKQLS